MCIRDSDTHVIIRISNQRRQLLQKITATICDLFLPTGKGRLRLSLIHICSKRDMCARKDPKVYEDAEDISSLPLSPWLVGFMLARGKCLKSKRVRPRTGDTVIDRKTYVALSDDCLLYTSRCV